MSQYEFSLTLIKFSLESLLRIVEKSESFAKEKGMRDEDFFSSRLAPDMYPFVSQIRIATDDARRNFFFLAGKEHVKMEDNETTFTELKNRISKTRELIDTLTSEDFKDADERHISLFWMKDSYVLGKDFVKEFAVQNTLFHVVTAYDIARNQGVLIGKNDYLGVLSMHHAQ